ncbi:hypothetical protein B484DRAFT_478491 [Ochromonadaceae sp. CCMP2298]|nr:hypothetical protein B484DRAFT_478491 [Ochromonadaceae sp. CCMP2298]|mmetsp:Transcript_6442/g.14228  ORF Transcript_6442/g.14228 Transcript_6442/m.14228 type:complete len:217 (+) Transcript_6442:104-754(+)
MSDSAVTAKMEEAVAVSALEVEISIVFGDETVKLNLAPEGFKFLEFESWLRSRFDLCSGDKVVYKDRKGNECLPTSQFFLKHSKLVVEKRGAAKPKDKKASAPAANPHAYAPLWVALICAALYQLQFVSCTPLIAYLTSIETQIIQSGVALKKGCFVDALITGICWPLTYIFVRRALNPENSKDWFKKYRVDSIFGGLAAAMTVILRGYVNNAFNQ